MGPLPHVLVVRLDGDGDVLLAGPAVRAVAAHSRRVTFLCSPRSRPVAELLPAVGRVITFEAPWVPADPPPLVPAEVTALIDRVAGQGIDEVLILTSFHQSPLPAALLMRMASVPRIAAISVDHPGSLLDVRHQVSEEIHEVERNLSLAAAAGYPLPPDDDGRLRVLRRPQRRPADVPTSPYVVVHPGASVPAQAWSPERNAEAAARLVAAGWQVVVTGAPSERPLCGYVASAAPGAVDLSGRTDISALAEVLAGAEAVVVGNAGPAHLAAAVGTPVVSIFAPTVPARRWRPWGVPHVVLGHQDIGCAGCRARVCPLEDQPCLGWIQVDEVVAAVTKLAGQGKEAAGVARAGPASPTRC